MRMNNNKFRVRNGLYSRMDRARIGSVFVNYDILWD